uniref:Uncharacterized protein n=1 Tax=Avena sativa TaxID=4498 RepID=A0ACD5YIN6_AVESA
MLQLCAYSEPLFRNLVAFEQTYPPGAVPCAYSICCLHGLPTAYAVFMDCLAASLEDMRLLELSGMLVNQMSGISTSETDSVVFFTRLSAEAHTWQLTTTTSPT